jgi:3-hydroxy acid dehydrogenase/malonic semialdehyde reductase
VLITGASAGIGKATAFEFARAAAPEPIKLILTARRVNVLEDIKKEIEAKYKTAKVYPVKLDVSNPDEVRGLVKSLPQEVQNVDILVNNAYQFSCVQW